MLHAAEVSKMFCFIPSEGMDFEGSSVPHVEAIANPTKKSFEILLNHKHLAEIVVLLKSVFRPCGGRCHISKTKLLLKGL